MAYKTEEKLPVKRPCHNTWHLFMKQYGKSEGELFEFEIK